MRDAIERGRLLRGPQYHADLKLDVRRILTGFTAVEQLDAAGWEDACAGWHDEGITWRYLQRLTVTARHVLEHAERLGLAAHGLHKTLPSPSNEHVHAEAKERRAYLEAERDRLLREVKKLDRRAWRIYVVLFATGLRKSMLERLELGQLDMRTGFAKLPGRSTKSRKPKEVWFPPEARAAVKQELAARGKIEPGAPIFGPFNVRGVFDKAVKAAGIARAGLTPHHATRHTVATMAGDAGATLAELLAIGTWDTPAMAMRYMHEDAARAKRGLQRLR